MMEWPFFLVLDAWLIAPFRWLQWSQASFVLGTFLLAVYCVAVGQICLWGINVIQRRRREKYDAETQKRTELAMQALMAKDKEAYLAQNTLAKDAYGNSMSLAVGRMTASLWPALLALAWMDLRFRDVPLELPVSLPLIGATVYYPFYFVLIYIFVRLGFARLKRITFRQRVERLS